MSSKEIENQIRSLELKIAEGIKRKKAENNENSQPNKGTLPPKSPLTELNHVK